MSPCHPLPSSPLVHLQWGKKAHLVRRLHLLSWAAELEPLYGGKNWREREGGKESLNN